MRKNPLLMLASLGQSIWLDYTRRDLILSGELRRLIEEDGVRGMTSNPSIFEKAIVNSGHYADDIQAMARRGETPNAIYESLSQHDVQAAADEFRCLYDRENGEDGFVSLEVSPHLAHDTQETLVEARRLWRALDRPNVFIKVPATAEGVPAIQQLIAEGINVNVTLLFALPRYRQVAEAYIAGLEARAAESKPLNTVASVASFFLSRIDSLIDPKLEKLVARGDANAKLAEELRGEVANASAKAAYQMYNEIFRGERFAKLAAKGARRQRLLWASTSTKNPGYDDLKYVDALVGPETINTVTVETLDAYRDHGKPKLTLERDVARANWVLEQLAALGLSLDKITAQLEDEGVEKFKKSFDNLRSALSSKAAVALALT